MVLSSLTQFIILSIPPHPPLLYGVLYMRDTAFLPLDIRHPMKHHKVKDLLCQRNTQPERLCGPF